MTDPFTVLPSMVLPGPQMVTAGRYRLPNRDGSPHKGGWTRATNLASAISDTKALGDWEVRMALLGVRELLAPLLWMLDRPYPPELMPVVQLLELDVDALEPKEIRAELMRLAAHFKKVAKAELGATRGNLAHQMVEHHHAGIPQAAAIPAETLEKLPGYITRLTVHRVEALPGMQERQVMVERFGVVGTLDNILRDLLQLEGCPYRIADLKTQKRFWSWLEIAIQLALYARGDAMWDKAKGRWVDMPVVDQSRALVAWMPWEHPTETPQVDMYEVDIERGWQAAQTAFDAYRLRAEAKRKGDPWGWLRPVPEATLQEAYAQRLLSIETRAEGSAVFAEAKAVGVWGPELEAVAAEILPRLTA